MSVWVVVAMSETLVKFRSTVTIAWNDDRHSFLEALSHFTVAWESLFSASLKCGAVVFQRFEVLSDAAIKEALFETHWSIAVVVGRASDDLAPEIRCG